MTASAAGVGHGRELRERAWRLELAAQAPPSGLRRVLAALVPRPRAIVFAAAAPVAMLPGLGVTGFLLQLNRDVSTATQLADGLAFFGAFSVAPAAALLVIGALFAGHHAARTVLFAATALLLTVGAASCSVGFSIGPRPIEGGARTATQFAALVWGPFILITGVATAAFAFLAPFRIHRDLSDDRCRAILDVLLSRGSVAIGDLSLAANAPWDRVRDCLERLVREGKLHVRVDDQNQRVFTARRLASRQALLVKLVEERVQVSIDQLALDLDEPIEVAGVWVRDLLAAGHLPARLEAEWVHFDPDGIGGAVTRSCEACGGPMKAVGRGVFHCAYCDSEAFA